MTGKRRTAATDLEDLVEDYIQSLRPERERDEYQHPRALGDR